VNVIARAECPVCGFWKNTDADVGRPCRRIGCDGIVEQVIYHRQPRGAVEAERERIVAWLRDLAAEESEHSEARIALMAAAQAIVGGR